MGRTSIPKWKLSTPLANHYPTIMWWELITILLQYTYINRTKKTMRPEHTEWVISRQGTWDMWPNPTKPGTSRKTCFSVNSHKRLLVQNHFQIFKFAFSCLLSEEQYILSNAWKNVFKWDFFQTINDGLSLLIPIHSCSKWETNWPISKKCSEAKIRRCHLQNQPYLEKCVCYKHDLGVILKLRLKWFTWY